MANQNEERLYTLYVFPFSLYSLMVRYTLALGGAFHTDAATRVLRVTLKLINLHHDEELAEDFLRNINPLGQVPVLAAASPDTEPLLPKPMPDSLPISYLLVREHYPGLLPALHAEAIRGLLSELHAIEGMSLSVRKISPEMAVRVLNNGLEDRLKMEDISEEYRQMLRVKKD